MKRVAFIKIFFCSLIFLPTRQCLVSSRTKEVYSEWVITLDKNQNQQKVSNSSQMMDDD